MSKYSFENISDDKNMKMRITLNEKITSENELQFIVDAAKEMIANYKDGYIGIELDASFEIDKEYMEILFSKVRCAAFVLSGNSWNEYFAIR